MHGQVVPKLGPFHGHHRCHYAPPLIQPAVSNCNHSNRQCSPSREVNSHNVLRLAGEWGSGDDRRLLKALLQSGVTMAYEVKWGELVPRRTGVQVRRRWLLMLREIPDRQEWEFAEQLEYLTRKFIPELWKKYGQSSEASAQKKSVGQAST